MDNIVDTINKLKDDEKVQEVVKEVVEKAKDIDPKEALGAIEKVKELLPDKDK